MKHKSRIAGIAAVSAIITLTSMAPGTAAPGDLMAEIQTPKPVEMTAPEVRVGKIESIPSSEVSGGIQSRATACNQQNVILQYPELSFTGVKKWCYDGTRVTQGTMDVKTYIESEHRYTDRRDGWVYVPSGLKKTDQFITVNGVERATHKSVRTGRFEYRIHGQSKPQTVYIPSVTRTGYGSGDCKGPKPTDLAPKIIAVAPSPGQTGFVRGGNIVAQLNMEVKEGTANIGTFYAINTRTGEYVEGTTGRYSPDLSMMIIIPDEDFEQNTRYTATIAAGPNGVLGETGDPLLGGAKWTFTTGSK